MAGLGVCIALEDSEGGALGIGDHCETADLEFDGGRQLAAVGALGLVRGVLGILDPEVREPVRLDSPLLLGLLAHAPVEPPAFMIVV
jgi:hypothetical protein